MKVSDKRKRRARFERRCQEREESKFRAGKSLTPWDIAGIRARKEGACCPCKFFDASTVAAVWCYCDCHLTRWVRIQIACMKAAAWALLQIERVQRRFQRA